MPDPVTMAAFAALQASPVGNAMWNIGCGLFATGLQATGKVAWTRASNFWNDGKTPQNHDVLKATHAAYVAAMGKMAAAASVIAFADDEVGAAKALTAKIAEPVFKDFRWDAEHLPLDACQARIESLFAGRHMPEADDEDWARFNQTVVEDLAAWGVLLPPRLASLFVVGEGSYVPWHLCFRAEFAEEIKADHKKPEGARAFRILTFGALNELTAGGAVLTAEVAKVREGIVDLLEGQAAQQAIMQRILSEVQALQAANLRPNLSDTDVRKIDEAIKSSDPEVRRSAYLSRKIVNMARANHELVLDMRKSAPATCSKQQEEERFRDKKFEGDLLRAEGELASAVDAYETALAIKPKDGYTCAALANTLIDMALRHRPDGNHWIRGRDEFGDVLEKAGKLVLPFMDDGCDATVSGRVAAIRAFSHIWFEIAHRGLAAPDAGQQSTDALEKADSIDPNNPTTLRLIGRNVHLLLKDQSKAEEYFKRAISVDIEGVDTRFFYALFLTEQVGRECEAKEMFESCLLIEPDDPYVLEAFANFLSQWPAQEQRAERLWKHSVRVHPGHPVGWLHYGRFLSKRAEQAIQKQGLDAAGQCKTAEDTFKQGLQHRPNDGRIWCEYAVLLEHLKGRESDAILAYEKALAWQPESVEPYVRLHMLKIIGGISKDQDAIGVKIMNDGLQKREPRLVVSGAWISLLFGAIHDQTGALALLKSMQGHFGDELQFLIQSRVIAYAVDAGNFHGPWLSKLADVIGGLLPLSALDDWPEWQSTEIAL
ncbi:MAG: hypothetical protein R3E02_16705 [Blastomonas sp.]